MNDPFATAKGTSLATQGYDDPPVPVQIGMLSAATPRALVSVATECATSLADIVNKQQLSVKLQGRPYVKVEGWLTLATMMGCLPAEVSNHADSDGVYTAVVELRRISDGAVLCRASGECGAADEVDRNGNPTWASRPAYARRSMAATRATAKACRLAFSWVMSLAGYETTPYEEMQGVQGALIEHESQPKAPAAQDERKVTTPQVKRLYARSKELGLDIERVKDYVQRATGCTRFEDMTRHQYQRLDEKLEELAKAAESAPEPAQATNKEEVDDDIPF